MSLSARFAELKALVERKFDLVEPEATIAAKAHEVTEAMVTDVEALKARVELLENHIALDLKGMVAEQDAKLAALNTSGTSTLAGGSTETPLQS